MFYEPIQYLPDESLKHFIAEVVAEKMRLLTFRLQSTDPDLAAKAAARKESKRRRSSGKGGVNLASPVSPNTQEIEDRFALQLSEMKAREKKLCAKIKGLTKICKNYANELDSITGSMKSMGASQKQPLKPTPEMEALTEKLTEKAGWAAKKETELQRLTQSQKVISEAMKKVEKNMAEAKSGTLSEEKKQELHEELDKLAKKQELIKLETETRVTELEEVRAEIKSGGEFYEELQAAAEQDQMAKQASEGLKETTEKDLSDSDTDALNPDSMATKPLFTPRITPGETMKKTRHQTMMIRALMLEAQRTKMKQGNLIKQGQSELAEARESLERMAEEIARAELEGEERMKREKEKWEAESKELREGAGKNLEEMTKSLGAEIRKEYEGKISELEAEIARLEEKIRSLKSELGGVEEELGEKNRLFAALREEHGALGLAMAEMKIQLEALEAEKSRGFGDRRRSGGPGDEDGDGGSPGKKRRVGETLKWEVKQTHKNVFQRLYYDAMHRITRMEKLKQKFLEMQRNQLLDLITHEAEMGVLSSEQMGVEGENLVPYYPEMFEAGGSGAALPLQKGSPSRQHFGASGASPRSPKSPRTLAQVEQRRLLTKQEGYQAFLAAELRHLQQDRDSMKNNSRNRWGNPLTDAETLRSMRAELDQVYSNRPGSSLDLKIAGHNRLLEGVSPLGGRGMSPTPRSLSPALRILSHSPTRTPSPTGRAEVHTPASASKGSTRPSTAGGNYSRPASANFIRGKHEKRAVELGKINEKFNQSYGTTPVEKSSLRGTPSHNSASKPQTQVNTMTFPLTFNPSGDGDPSSAVRRAVSPLARKAHELEELHGGNNSFSQNSTTVGGLVTAATQESKSRPQTAQSRSFVQDITFPQFGGLAEGGSPSSPLKSLVPLKELVRPFSGGQSREKSRSPGKLLSPGKTSSSSSAGNKKVYLDAPGFNPEPSQGKWEPVPTLGERLQKEGPRKPDFLPSYLNLYPGQHIRSPSSNSPSPKNAELKTSAMILAGHGNHLVKDRAGLPLSASAISPDVLAANNPYAMAARAKDGMAQLQERPRSGGRGVGGGARLTNELMNEGSNNVGVNLPKMEEKRRSGKKDSFVRI